MAHVKELLDKYGYYKPFYDRNVTPSTKKYSVVVKRKKANGQQTPRLIHFGARSMQHYKDRTEQKQWSNLDHNDKERRARYLARATKINDKHGRLVANDMNSANYYAIKFLW